MVASDLMLAIQNYTFTHAWSNWLMQAAFLLMLFFSTKDKDFLRSPFFYSISIFFIINFLACFYHGYERHANIEELTNRLNLINHGLITFGALFIEFLVIFRIRYLSKTDQDMYEKLKHLPLKSMVAIILVSFVSFQFKIWGQEGQPDFLYPMAAYSVSLLITSTFCLFVLVRLKNKNRQLKFEKYMLIGAITIMLASIFQQLPTIRQIIPMHKNALFYYNDLYHIFLIIGFLFFFFANEYRESCV